MFARMIKTSSGAQISNPNKQHVCPTPFGSQRAQEIVNEGPPHENIRDKMTDGELVYVLAVWDCLDGNYCWMSAFNHILKGHIEIRNN